jgi:hypothetical protein
MSRPSKPYSSPVSSQIFNRETKTSGGGHIVFSKVQNTCSALIQVRQTAERLYHEIGASDGVPIRAHVKALYDITIKKFQQKRIKLNNKDKYNKTACQQHLLSATAYMNYSSVVKDLL